MNNFKAVRECFIVPPLMFIPRLVKEMGHPRPLVKQSLGFFRSGKSNNLQLSGEGTIEEGDTLVGLFGRKMKVERSWDTPNRETRLQVNVRSGGKIFKDYYSMTRNSGFTSLFAIKRFPFIIKSSEGQQPAKPLNGNKINLKKRIRILANIILEHFYRGR